MYQWRIEVANVKKIALTKVETFSHKNNMKQVDLKATMYNT